MVTITRSTKEPWLYLALLWVATISVVVLAVVVRSGRIQLNAPWLVDCLAILFCIAIVHTTFRTAFPIEYKAVITSDTVEFTNSLDPHACTSISKNEVRYFFRWKKVWYRPRAWIYHVRYLCCDDRIGLIGMRYIAPLDTPEFLTPFGLYGVTRMYAINDSLWRVKTIHPRPPSRRTAFCLIVHQSPHTLRVN